MLLTSTCQFGTHSLPLEIARGNVYGASVVHKFGRVQSITTANAEDVWDFGGSYNFPVAACKVDVESSASTDHASGVGARTIQVYGLDANFVEQTETLTLTGRDKVTTSGDYIRMHRMVVRSGGTSGEAAGNITATHTGTTSAVAQVTAGFNQTLMAIYTIPASRTGYMYQWSAGIDRNGINTNRSGDVVLKVRPDGEVFQTKDTAGLFNARNAFAFPFPQKYGAKSDIRVSASAAANGVGFSASFDILLLDNSVNI